MPEHLFHVTFEPLSLDDVVAVAHCIALDATVFPYPSASFGFRDAAARAWVARDRPEGPGRGAVLGFVAGHVRRRRIHIGGLAVDADCRRRGIGRALVGGLVEQARVEGMDAVALHVSVTNRAAIALYRAEGFIVQRRLVGFYPPAAYGGEPDAYEMTLPAREG